MNNHVYWVLELTLQKGRMEFDALMSEMVQATQANEPGTLNYEWTLNEAGTICHIYERYADSEAVMTHLAAFGAHFAERFLALFAPLRFTVYGDPSPAVKEALAAFNPTYMGFAGGFGR